MLEGKMGASHSALPAWEASYRGVAPRIISTSMFLTMRMLVAVKMAVLLASQCWPTDRRGMCQ